MALKDIEKLKEKVEKDPNSKLFVPLAEEYRKEGLLDEAISVLLTCIEKQPGYMSARVALGKIYLEKSMLPEAKAEFENVIKAIPDNLYAHKKLADIYRETGDRDHAIQSYKAVLKLNAMDEEALTSLNDMESGIVSEEQAGETTAPAEAAVAEEAVVTEESARAEEHIPEDDLYAVTGEDEAEIAPHSEEELSAFKDSIFGVREQEKEELTEGFELEEEETVEAEKEISFGDVGEALKAGEQETAIAEEASVSEAAEEDIFTKEEKTSPERKQTSGRDFRLEEAEQKISEGSYGEALQIYRGLIQVNPDDTTVLQRIEELRALLKLMGKDKEELIGKLNAFLDGIKKGRDEFFRRT
ncbi:MAG: hypothetical protein HZA17_08020 [Nitrospirae bacterium]|nr:hypothetical protein [Nitrospirota bacterium]